MIWVETVDAFGKRMIPLGEKKPVEVKEEVPVEAPVKEETPAEEVPVKKTRAKKAKT